MNRILEEELEHIPKVYDDLPQSLLRCLYNATRRQNMKFGETKEEAIVRSIEAMKKVNPSWEPTYDKAFFGSVSLS